MKLRMLNIEFTGVDIDKGISFQILLQTSLYVPQVHKVIYNALLNKFMFYELVSPFEKLPFT